MILDRAQLAEHMNRLPFVRWDRYAERGEGGGVVYGWIDRDDAHADFVLLEFDQREDGVAVGFSTSSAKHSSEISEILFGVSDDHEPCRRVDADFGDLVANKVVAA